MAVDQPVEGCVDDGDGGLVPVGELLPGRQLRAGGEVALADEAIEVVVLVS